MQCSIGGAHAQNLFANPGFEAINNCVEYKADCATEAWFNIPATNILVNGRKAPNALLGHMVLIVPVGNVMANFNKPRYVYTRFCCPLKKDTKYSLSFYLHTATLRFNGLAIYLTEKEPALSNINLLPAEPSIVISQQHIAEVPGKQWQFVKIDYTATGNEQYFIFTTKGLPLPEYKMENGMNKSGDVLHFIDEINFAPVQPGSLCADYEKNRDILFAYNYRHTDNYPVYKEPERVKPVVQFINDTITIPGLLFDVNKSDIKPPAAKILDSLAAALQQQLFLQINITGHTDSTGKEKDNQLLSQSRAEAIKNYLAEKLPAKADKMTAAGKAALLPVAGNTTAAGRQRNRRVEIIITYIKSVQ
jgi:outer membrane protein OmpA-like peptidoglycan-associated protein